jgi:DNA-binding CsgD family transcriptional regulator
VTGSATGGEGQTGDGRDVGHRGRLESALGEQLGGSIDDHLSARHGPRVIIHLPPGKTGEQSNTRRRAIGPYDLRMGAVVTLVIGPGGCGKTHLVDALAGAHDGPVTRVRGTDITNDTAFGAFLHLIEDPEPDRGSAVGRIAEVVGHDGLLVVDDAHLLDEGSLRVIVDLAGHMIAVAVAHRPLPRRELALFDDEISTRARVVHVRPLDEAGLAAVLAAASGAAVDSDRASAVHSATGGVPGWALAVARHGDPVADAPAALSERVDAELARSSPIARPVAEVAALAPDLPDDVLAAATDLTTDEVRAAFDELAVAGLLDPVEGVLWPCIAVTCRALSSGARRRALHDRLARALLDRGGEVRDAARHLLRSGATGADAAAVYIRAGDELRFRDPEAAIAWYGEAAVGEAGAETSIGPIEAEAFAGRPIVTRAAPEGLDAVQRARLLAIRAVDEARSGRPSRAADLLDAVADGGAPHPVLGPEAAHLFASALRSAAPSTDGRTEPPAPEPPEDLLDPLADLAHRLAVACVGGRRDQADVGVRFTAAADLMEHIEPNVVLPDSPHAIGALHLAAVGDLSGASILTERATGTEPGGPVLSMRHRLLDAWVALRRARYEKPAAIVRNPPEVVDPRDRVVWAAIAAGLARRNGDIARLRDAWSTAEPLLLAGVADLFHLEVIGELVLAAARLGHSERADATMNAFSAMVQSTTDNLWRVPHAWLELNIAVEADNADGADGAAGRLRESATDAPFDRSLVVAADLWTVVVGGDIDRPDRIEEVDAAAESLARRGLRWEASRLAGQAAIRVADTGDARRLLDLARRLHRSGGEAESIGGSEAGLSPREVEIARYVVDGVTYREIGAQLYLSPKTVEHHVARIRRKVRAESRAEMLAILREILPTPGDAHEQE